MYCRTADAALRRAIRLHPHDAKAHHGLGRAFEAQGKLEEAVAEYRAVIRLWPDHAHAYNNLGRALSQQGKLDEAIAEHRTAIRLDPDDAGAHGSLGIALAGQGKADAAIAEFRESIRLQPNDSESHSALGLALAGQGKLDSAIAEFRESIRLQPDHAMAHFHFAQALSQQAKLGEAIAEYRTAIRQGLDTAPTHYASATPSRTRASSTRPSPSTAPRFGFSPTTPKPIAILASSSSSKVPTPKDWRCCGKGTSWAPEGPTGSTPPRSGSPRPSASLLAPRLTAVLRGDENPKDDAERLDFARLAYNQKLFVAATRLRAEALASNPQLGDDRGWGHRYKAACTAALAGSGQGKDHPPLDDAGKATLRGQARDWLKAELTTWAKFLESGAPRHGLALFITSNTGRGTATSRASAMPGPWPGCQQTSKKHGERSGRMLIHS